MKGSVSFLPVNHDPWADLPKGELGASQGPMSWTDYLPFVKEAIKIYGKEKLGEILGAVTAPGEALAGRLDPGTPEGLKRVQALAGLAMGGPAKPSGAMGAGWQFPHDLALGYWSKSPTHKDAFDLVSHMKETGKSIQEAAQDLGASEKTVGKLQNVFMPKPEKYSHPHNASWSEHPATYGMSEPEVRAAEELLESMKLYPDQYKSPKEAILGLGDFVAPHELPHFESATKKLEDWAGPHGFKFEEAPKKELEIHPNLAGEFETFLSSMKSEAKKIPEPYTPSPTVPIPEALYPINWADLHSAVARPGQTASGEYADTLRRAESLGFNTNFPLYHGAFETKVKAPVNPAEGLWGPEAEKYHAFAHPATTKDFEPGIFTTDTPEIAQLYSGGSDAPLAAGQTFPLFANPKKTLALDWNAISSNPSYSGSLMHQAIKEARKQGAEALVVQGMQDVGGPQNQYIFLEPNVLRSMFARFDPAHLASANLTRSGGLPMFIPVDHDPFAEPTQ